MVSKGEWETEKFRNHIGWLLSARSLEPSLVLGDSHTLFVGIDVPCRLVGGLQPECPLSEPGSPLIKGDC